MIAKGEVEEIQEGPMEARNMNRTINYLPHHGVDIVDVRKKFHLKQLQKKRKINTIFATTSSVITLAILVISGILLYKFCLRSSRRQQNGTCHFNRIEERFQLGQ